MKFTETPGPEDYAADCERAMRVCLNKAQRQFQIAKGCFDMFDADPAVKADLWNKFNATERRLMKDEEGKEWTNSTP